MKKLDEAKKAIEIGRDFEYMESTKGFIELKKILEKEIKWAFEKSVSPSFKAEVKDRPEVYFEHYGYVNGLRQIDEILKKVYRNSEKAARDIDKWESKTNQHK